VIIDWFTVIAQVVNFLVLVWLLKRFLYRPILKTMDKRQKSIIDKLAEADQQMLRAEKKKQQYAEKILNFEKDKRDRVKLVEEEIREYHDKLLSEVKLSAEKSQKNWQQSIAKEQQDFIQQLRSKIGAEIIRLLRVSLKDLGDEELIASLSRMFTGRLYELDEQQRKTCAARAKTEKVEVVSSFILKNKEQAELSAAIQSLSEDTLDVDFTTDPELAPGILINIGGLRLSWGTEEYLDSLEKNISDMISHIVEPGPEIVS